MTNDYRKIIPTLVQGKIKFIVIGGVAAIVHGSARTTFDLDVVYSRDPISVRRLVQALKPFSPYLRDVPEGLPFKFDEKTVQNGLNFTLKTEIGHLDLFGEIVGGGVYEDLLPYSQEIEVFGVKCLCLGLEKLIQVKRAAGRPKDFEVIAELEAILEEQKKQKLSD
jgi:predicted nucleotidyltransferase